MSDLLMKFDAVTEGKRKASMDDLELYRKPKKLVCKEEICWKAKNRPVEKNNDAHITFIKDLTKRFPLMRFQGDMNASTLKVYAEAEQLIIQCLELMAKLSARNDGLIYMYDEVDRIKFAIRCEGQHHVEKFAMLIREAKLNNIMKMGISFYKYTRKDQVETLGITLKKSLGAPEKKVVEQGML